MESAFRITVNAEKQHSEHSHQVVCVAACMYMCMYRRKHRNSVRHTAWPGRVTLCVRARLQSRSGCAARSQDPDPE